MSKQQRLHPATIFFNFTRILRESIFAIVLGFITFRDESFVYFILILGAILIIFIIISALSWYRFTYQVEEDDLRVEYGIIIRKKRYISKNRIQSIDLSAGVIHRLFKLVKVQIETAGSGNGAEASLKAVKQAEGERLRSELKRGNVQQMEVESVVEAPKQPSYSISFKRLFLAGSTSGSVGIILAFFFFAFSQMEQFIPERFYENTLEWVIGLSIALIIGLGIILLIMLWLFGIAGTMIKYGNFKITKNKDELFITRGLLEKKQLTLPLRRIQAIGVQENLIRQPLGYVTIFAEVAGGSVEKGEDFSTVLFPIMKKGEVNDFLEKFLPGYATQPDELIGPPKRALKFYLFRSMILFLVLAAVIVYFFPQFSWIPVLFIGASLYLGILRYRDSGYHIQDNALTVHYRIFSKMTMIMYHKRIQSFEKKQHIIHKGQDLANAKLSIIGKYGAGKHYRLKELDEADANHLSSWYSYREQ